MAKTASIPNPSAPEWQFGIKWKPGYDDEFQRRRFCALNGLGTTPIWEHRKWMAQYIWPDDSTLAWHYWTDRRLQSTCRKSWVTWLGAGGIGKSNDAAMLALEWWLECPHASAVVVCSTSLVMLKRRIWSELVRLHGMIPKKFGHCGELLSSGTIIRWEHGDDKHGIFGIAIAEGSIEEARSQLVGIHADRVWWIIDEMQGIKPALLDGYTLGNLAKNPESRLLGMGNPSNLEDPLCRHSRPIDGWESVERGVTESWKTHGGPMPGGGICEFFDGRKSPAVLDPAWGKRHPWMISQKQIDDHLRFEHGNENAPSFWSQCIGWPPTIGTESTVLDPSIIETFKCRDKAVWTDGRTDMAALDPAWTFGGDRRILQFFRLGKVNDSQGSRWMIEFGDWVNVPISESSSQPVEYQIAHFCKEACEKRGLLPNNFALDSSGRGGGLKAILQTIWGPVVGVEFGGAASELPVKSFVDADGQLVVQVAREIYARRVAELNLCIREFALSNGLRGISNEIAEQGCARKTFFKNGKWGVQSKQEVAKSPDNLDAAAIACDLARQKGAMPNISTVTDRADDWNEIVRESDKQFSGDNYLEEQTFEEAFQL